MGSNFEGLEDFGVDTRSILVCDDDDETKFRDFGLGHESRFYQKGKIGTPEKKGASR